MGYELTVKKSEERMTIQQTLVAIALCTSVMIFGVTNSNAQIMQELPTPPPVFEPELDEPETQQLPPIARVNRDVPCTTTQVVVGLLESRGQRPIARGTATDPDEKFNQLVLTFNEETGAFSVIVVTADNVFACNLYSGYNFTRM